jgi:hypothetical protein
MRYLLLLAVVFFSCKKCELCTVSDVTGHSLSKEICGTHNELVRQASDLRYSYPASFSIVCVDE